MHALHFQGLMSMTLRRHRKKWRGKPRKPWIYQHKDQDQHKESENCHKVCQILLYEVFELSITSFGWRFSDYLAFQKHHIFEIE
jgi:hypothetical protein